MPNTEIKNLLAVGIDNVSIARSAKKAGYKVYAADYYGDIDLQHICSKHRAIIDQKPGKTTGRMEQKFKPETFLEMTKSLLEEEKIDGALLSSGLDDHSDILTELNSLVPILGNSPEVIERVRRKPTFFSELKKLGIAHPETVLVNTAKAARAAADKIGYPIVLKPIRGFGGTGIKTARNSKEIENACLADRDLIVQKLLTGTHASICLLSTDNDVKVLTINEQLLGLRSLHQQEPFGYCGNIVPLNVTNSTFEKCQHIAEKIALHFSLKGSNGVDLVISEEGTPYVVEVNPRFQGTLECVERVLKINLVKLHINACLHNSFPMIKEKEPNFCIRLILYAPRRIVTADLSGLQGISDIPHPGVMVEKGEPICSVSAEGKNRESSFHKARKLAKSIYAASRSV